MLPEVKNTYALAAPRSEHGERRDVGNGVGARGSADDRRAHGIDRNGFGDVGRERIGGRAGTETNDEARPGLRTTIVF